MASLHLVHNQLDESKRVFSTEKESLLKLLHNFHLQVEHIGSTALPNSLTKPVLDILLIALSPDDQAAIAILLANLGYSQGELGRQQTKLFFHKPFEGESSESFIESIHLHLTYKTTHNQDDLVSIKVRDYLLKHPVEVEVYSAEKERLADIGNHDRGFYVTHKEPYIKKLIEKVAQ